MLGMDSDTAAEVGTPTACSLAAPVVEPPECPAADEAVPRPAGEVPLVCPEPADDAGDGRAGTLVEDVAEVTSDAAPVVAERDRESSLEPHPVIAVVSATTAANDTIFPPALSMNPSIRSAAEGS